MNFKAVSNMRTLITKLILCLQVMLCSVVLVNHANAEQNSNSALREVSQYEKSIQDLVFDQTITPQGREFYRAFIKAWGIQNDTERHHVLVYEQSTNSGTNKLWVEYRLRSLFSGILSMNEQRSLDKMGAYAAQAVLQGITSIQAQEM